MLPYGCDVGGTLDEDDGPPQPTAATLAVGKGQAPHVLIRDDCDEIAIELLRYGDNNGDRWADVIDLFARCPEMRREAARLLAEMSADS